MLLYKLHKGFGDQSDVWVNLEIKEVVSLYKVVLVALIRVETLIILRLYVYDMRSMISRCLLNLHSPQTFSLTLIYFVARLMTKGTPPCSRFENSNRFLYFCHATGVAL